MRGFHLLEMSVLDPTTVLRPLLRLAPAPVHSRAIAFFVNRLMRGQSIEPRLTELAGKRFCLHVQDVPLALTFEITAAGLRRSDLDADVTFRGALRDFASLAARREDPDALFFQRRLAVEGETETGLHLKNLLDGWEYDVPGHLRAVLPAPVARFTEALANRARVLPGLCQLRRPGSHRNNHREDRARETRSRP